MSSEANGIGMIASAITTGSYLSYLNILGCTIILIGIILNIVSIIVARKQNS
jgi:hypothetical protein